MVDTTIAPAVQIQPPFADPVPDKASPDVHSQPWNDFLTKQADRVTDTYQRMGVAEGDIATLQAKMGVTDGSDAVAGQIGEYMTATASAGLANGVAADIASITLTAGDWDVTGWAYFAPTLITMSYCQAWVGTAAGTPADPGRALIQSAPVGGGTLGLTAMNVGPVRFSLVAASTVVHLGCQSGFPSGTSVTASANIRARRVR